MVKSVCPPRWWVFKLFVCCFGRRLGKELFSCDAETATRALFKIAFVDLGQNSLECGAVEALCQHCGIPDDKRPGFKLFNAAALHLLLNAVLETVDLGLCLLCYGFPFF